MNKVLKAIKSHKDLIAYNREVEKEALNKVQNAVESLDLSQCKYLLDTIDYESEVRSSIEKYIIKNYKNNIIEIEGSIVKYNNQEKVVDDNNWLKLVKSLNHYKYFKIEIDGEYDGFFEFLIYESEEKAKEVLELCSNYFQPYSE